MSIYIKGMEMLQLFDRLFVGKDLDGKIYIRNEREDRDRESPKWYPAIEIPPRGRLIDADDLYQLLDGGYDVDLDELPETKAALLEMIETAPTIIPADKEV